MPEKTVERSPFLERVPDLESGKWGGMEVEAGETLVTDILKAGKPAVQQLIDGLQEVDDGTDWKERLLLHQLSTQCSVEKRQKERGMLAEVFLAAALGDHPAPVRAFLLQQLRYIAGSSGAKPLAPLLRDASPLVLDAATAVLVSIGNESRPVLEEAMKGADGHAKVAIAHALHQLS